MVGFLRLSNVLVLALAIGVVAPNLLWAQSIPEDLVFKRVRSSVDIVLKACPLIPNVNRFQVLKLGRLIQPAAKYGRKAYKFPVRHRFFACDTDDQGVTSLYVKQTVDGAVSQFAFSPSDFPKTQSGDLSKVCPSGTKGVGFGVLWKPHADASHQRAGKPVVLLQGGNKIGGSSLKVYSTNGKEVCRLSFKASSIPGINGGSDHYFSGWSGGCAKTGSQIAAAAKSASGGNSNVYLQAKGGKCLGPVNPTARVGGIG